MASLPGRGGSASRTTCQAKVSRCDRKLHLAAEVPASYVNVFSPAELVLLALAGLVIGVAGALLPASWAARARTATALRAE
jgi:hypothetical protein